MARLQIKCIDSESNEVIFVTSDKEGKELVASYPAVQKWLSDNGFTQVAAKGTKSSKVWKFDGKTCPKCNKSEVWDNRGKIASNEFSPKSPHFACRDKSCGWAVWEGQYEGNDTAEDTSDGAPVPYTPPTENNDIVKEAKDIMGVEEDYGTPEDAIEG